MEASPETIMEFLNLVDIQNLIKFLIAMGLLFPVTLLVGLFLLAKLAINKLAKPLATIASMLEHEETP